MATENLRLLREFDRHIEEVLFTVKCSAWKKRPFVSIDGSLFIVKRTAEPKIQIFLKPEPSVPGIDILRIHWVESSARFEEVEPSFLLPSQSRGFVVFFNNSEDSTRAADCIKRLVDTREATDEPEERHIHIEEEEHRGSIVTRPIRRLDTTAPTDEIIELRGEGVDEVRVGPLHEEEQGGGGGAIGISHRSMKIDTPHQGQGTPGNNSPIWDKNVYLQNTRVIMAMIAVLLATIVLTVGLNPPSTINKLWLKILFQITFWVAGLFSLAALFLLCVLTPTSFDMQSHIFRCSFIAISVALVCVVVGFGATTVSMDTNMFANILGGFIGLIGLIFFLYFTSQGVRGLIFRVTSFRLTQHADNEPYSLTTFSTNTAH